jgi:hypothetical protein
LGPSVKKECKIMNAELSVKLISYWEWEKKSQHVTDLKMLTILKTLKKFRTIIFLLINWHAFIILNHLRLK